MVKNVDSGVGCHAVSGACQKRKDHHLGLGVGARRRKRNHSMGLGTVLKLTRKIWTNTKTSEPLGVNPVQLKSSRQTTERDRPADA